MSSNKAPQLKVNSVLSLFSNRQFSDAIDAIDLLKIDYPKDELLLNINGACYAGLGQFDAAIELYEEALLINPNYAKVYFNLGGAYHELSQLDEAIINYKKSSSSYLALSTRHDSNSLLIFNRNLYLYISQCIVHR